MHSPESRTENTIDVGLEHRLTALSAEHDPACRILQASAASEYHALCPEAVKSIRIGFPADEHDLEALHQIRLDCSGPDFQTEKGTPYLKPLDESALLEKLPTSLVLYHRDDPIGTLYFTSLEQHESTGLIGGFAVAPGHRNLRFGRTLLHACLEKMKSLGFQRAVSITAAPAVKKLYASCGSIDENGEFDDLLETSRHRFYPEETGDVLLYVFEISEK